ncbi:MAG: beta-lactamase family protein [Gemmatimonadaceae bacterium]|nr:beta-lactamase family protein [Gemmatimonadaceae bacterium]
MSPSPLRLFVPITAIIYASSCRPAPHVWGSGASSTDVSSTDASATLARIDLMLTRYAMYGMSGSADIKLGRRRLTKAFGFADRASGRLNTPSTLFDVGSVAKTFTAAAILRLADGGRLRVTDSLSRYFPEFQGDNAGVTIHHLLTHTSGLPLDAGDAGVTARDERAAFITKASRVKLLSLPGTAYNYSNLGYGLLAIIIERVSGRSYVDFIAKSLIEAGGLRASAMYGDSIAINDPRAAVGYIAGGEDTLVREPTIAREVNGSMTYGKYTLGSVGLLATAADLSQWWNALTTGILSASSHDVMLTPSFGDEGYGWHIAARPSVGKRIYRGGARGGFTSLISIYPERDATLVLLLNQQPSGWETLAWTAFERALTGEQDSLPPSVVPMKASDLATYAARYEINDSSAVIVKSQGNQLVIGLEGQSVIDLVVPDTDTAVRTGQRRVTRVEQNEAAARLIEAALYTSSVELPGVSDRAGFVTWLKELSAGGRPLVLGTTPHPSASTRTQTFVRFGEGDARVGRIIWQGGRVLAWGSGIQLPVLIRLLPVGADRFAAFGPKQPLLVVSFTRDAGGVISELRYGRQNLVARRTSGAN